MFSLDRETVTVVAIVVCVIAVIYIYRELNKMKQELTKAIAGKQNITVKRENTETVAVVRDVPNKQELTEAADDKIIESESQK